MKANHSIINRQRIDPLNRIDADFYDNDCIGFEDKLISIGSKPLSSVCKRSQSTFNPNKYFEADFSYIEITDIDLEDGMYTSDIIQTDEAPYRATQLCKFGDIIISTVRPNRNAVAFITNKDNRVVCSSGFLKIKSLGDLQPEIIFIFLKTKFAIKQITRRTRATMYPAVASRDIFEIQIPPISKTLTDDIIKGVKEIKLQQEEILLIQDKINKKINNYIDEILNSFHFHEFDIANNKRTLSRNMIFQEDNRIDAEYYRKVFDILENKLLSNANIKKVCNLFNIVTTGATPPKYESREIEESNFAIVKVAALTDIGINWNKVEYVSESFFKKNNKYVLAEGDILFTSSAHSIQHIGKKVNVVTNIPDNFINKVIFSGELILLRNTSKKLINPLFVAPYLMSDLGYIQIQKCVRGISSHLYPIDVNKILIPIPDEKTENYVSDLVYKQDTIKKFVKKNINQLILRFENEIEQKIDSL